MTTPEDFARWVNEGGVPQPDHVEDEVTWIAKEAEFLVDRPDDSPPYEPEPEPETANIVVPKEIVTLIQTAPSGKEILSTCIDLAVFLSQKNISYGNSAIEPIRIFSSADNLEQIKVRIDDKLNRIMHDGGYQGDDDIK